MIVLIRYGIQDDHDDIAGWMIGWSDWVQRNVFFLFLQFRTEKLCCTSLFTLYVWYNAKKVKIVDRLFGNVLITMLTTLVSVEVLILSQSLCYCTFCHTHSENTSFQFTNNSMTKPCTRFS